MEAERDAALERERELRAGGGGRDNDVEVELLSHNSKLRAQLHAAHTALRAAATTQMAVVEQVEQVRYLQIRLRLLRSLASPLVDVSASITRLTNSRREY